MSSHADLLSLVVVVLVALGCGMIFTRLRQPALVGYLLSGIVLGPSGLALVQSRESIDFLAELGVLLLLFFVGMELSLRGFRLIWRTALASAALQIACATGLMLLLSKAFGWSPGAAVLFGFVVAISSTAVAVKMLESMNILRTQVGQLTVAILIAQDLAIVPMMLVVGQFAQRGGMTEGLVAIALSVVVLALLVWQLSRRQKVHLPFSGLLAGSVELRPLYGLVACLGAATVTGLLGLTPAYGAFLAGLVVGNSNVRRVILRSIQPVQNILLMAFFLSVGLLIDLDYLWANAGKVLAILFIVTVVKTALNIGILALLREPWPHAFISGVLLAQIGEFSFLLGSVGRDTGLIAGDEFQLIVTVTACTLIVSPLWLVTARRMLRIAVAGASSVHDALDRLRGGGLKAMWLAAKSRPLPPALAARIFGRPRRSPGRDAADDAERAPPKVER